ncbi:MAG: hypothetical protein ACTSXF_02315 [Promethearchaeota archaeon]
MERIKISKLRIAQAFFGRKKMHITILKIGCVPGVYSLSPGIFSMLNDYYLALSKIFEKL